MELKQKKTENKELKEINSSTNIVFVSGYSEYAVNVFSLNASGYILKPARKIDVENSLENLRIPVKYDEGKLRIQCFGNFDVFVGNEKVAFKRALRANFNLNELRAFFL